METDTFYLAGPDGQVWTELSQTRNFGGCREEPAGEAGSSGNIGPLQTDPSSATEPDLNRIGNSGEERLADETGGRGYSEQAIKYQFTDHLGSTRFTAGLWWTPGMLDIDEAGLESWHGEPTLHTSEYPENGTPYGGLLRSAAPPVPVPLHLVFADPVHFTGKPKDIESGLTFFGARYYSDQLCRWPSPDLILINEDRQLDPQQLNLYGYARCNPLRFIDPTGLDITVTGTDQTEYVERLQASTSAFKIKSDSSGKIAIDGTVNARNLTGADRELYKAITDTRHHVTINTTSGDPNVDFGRFDGGGQNTIDMTDIKLLDSPQNAGGISGAQVVGHETLEAYASSKGKNLQNAHDYATGNFGALGGPIPSSLQAFGPSNNPNVITKAYCEMPVINTARRDSGVRLGITRIFLSPIPVNAIPQEHIPAHIIDAVKKP